jgi:hypothetical protein
VLHSVVYQQQIWMPDPFDVETIHEEARETFQRLLNRAAMQPPPPSGRVLLLLGVSGSGKTHLMRAFRNYVHADDRGYCGYLQMTSQVSNYARYLLSNLIDSLDQPYRDPQVQTSGLMRLSLGLVEAVGEAAPAEREHLRDGDTTGLTEVVEGYADRIIADPRFHGSDLDLIRALLFLQRDDPRLKSRVLKWLRCEDLSPHDRALLGEIVPRNQEEAPLRMITQLGWLMRAAHGIPLVLCIDQLEDTFDQEKGKEQFRRAVDTLVALTDAIPSSVVIISCLEDYFQENRQFLMKPKLDRLERDPEPIRLASQRTAGEVEALVARRLQSLYDEQDVPYDEQAPTFPFTRAQLAPLAGLRTRDVLDFCRQHREKCVRAGHWVAPEVPPPDGGGAEPGIRPCCRWSRPGTTSTPPSRPRCWTRSPASRISSPGPSSSARMKCRRGTSSAPRRKGVWFRWRSTARVTPSAGCWSPSAISPPGGAASAGRSPRSRIVPARSRP